LFKYWRWVHDCNSWSEKTVVHYLHFGLHGSNYRARNVLWVLWHWAVWLASPMLSMWPSKKNFLHPRLVISFFSNLTHKTKTGTANRWETTNNNPPGPTKLSSQSSVGVRLCCAFYQPHHFSKVGPKPFCWAKLACFDFSSSNFHLFGHILSTSWAALRALFWVVILWTYGQSPSWLLVQEGHFMFFWFFYVLDFLMHPLKSSTYPFFVGCGWSFLSLTFWTLRVLHTWIKTLLVSHRPKILLWVQFYFY
jgi:hypothetical protein